MIKRNIIKAIIGAAALLGVFTMPAYAANSSEAAYTTTRVNIRTAPAVSEDTYITTLSKNTRVDIVEDLGDWDKVTYQDQEVYICEKYLASVAILDTIYSAAWFKQAGVFHYNGYKWTWYSETALPGGGLNIAGRHLDEQNYVCDENGRIVVACGSLPKGTIISSPLGKECIVLDSCPTSGVIDVYTHF